MLNGIYARDVGADPANDIKGIGSNPGYAGLTDGSYKSNLLLVNKQFGHVTSVYDTPTTNQVAIFQRSVVRPVTGKAPTVTGKVDAATWQQLCYSAVNTQLSSDGHTLTTRDVAVHTHTPEGYADSYRRAGVTAGLNAGCTPPPKPVVPTSYNECLELDGKFSSTATNESCTLDGKKFTVASDDVPAAWGHVTSATVNLRLWKVTFTAPQSLVGNLYYQVDPGENIYDFTTTKMFAPSCIAYFNNRNQEASVEFDQYALNKPAKDIAPNAGSMTLDQYYASHKASNGNYFLDANGRKVWKIGNHFYEMLTDTSLYMGSAFAKACPGVSSQYQTLLADAVATVKE
jgi:hypothetical protein